MSLISDDRLLHVLRAALPPPGDRPPAADLWPRVQARAGRQSTPPPSAVDWMLAALVVVACALRPSAIGLLLFHF